MPALIPRACRKRGCAGTTTDRSGYCEQHRNEGWQQHQQGKSRHERGYGSKWDIKRARILKRDNHLCQNCLRTGRAVAAKDDGLRELERKALQVGVDEDGGYAVPEELDRTILNLLKDEVVMRQEATTITVGGANYKKLVNLGGTASGWVGETDARPETDASN